MLSARARDSVLLGALLALTCLAAFFRICDNDVWWHIRTGEIILDTRAIPRTDPFSHLAKGHEWITHSWASDVAMALASRAGGLPGVSLAKCAVCVLLSALLWRLARGAGAGPAAAFCAVLLFVATARFRFFERPHLATYLALPLALEWLARRASRPESGFTRRDLAIPFLFLLWANFHAGFLLGLALFPLVILVASLRGIRARLGPTPPNVRGLLLLFALSCAASLANPSGYRAHLYPLINERALRSVRNGEWLPPSAEQFPLFFVLLGTVALLVPLGWRAAGLARLLPLAPLAAMALRSNRSIGEFAVASAVPLALLGGAAWSRAHAPLARRAPWAAAAGPVAFPVLLALALAGLHARGLVIDTSFYRPGLGVNASRFPIAAADYVERRGLSGPMANAPGFGGYLIWRFWPERLVFADGRLDVFVDVNETLVRTPWPATVERLGLTYGILETEGGLGPDPLLEAIARSPAWALVDWDDAATVWAKRTAAHEAAIREDAYLVASPLRDAMEIPDDSLAAAEAEYARAAREALPFHAQFGLGIVRLRRGDAEGAALALGAAASLRPDDPLAQSNLAYALLAARRPGDALVAARRAVQLAPRDPISLRNLGVAYFELGRFREAQDALLRARTYLPGNPDIEGRLRECRKRLAGS